MDQQPRERLQREILRYRTVQKLRLIQKARRKTAESDAAIRSRFVVDYQSVGTEEGVSALSQGLGSSSLTIQKSNNSSNNISSLIIQTPITAYNDDSISQVAVLMAAHHVDYVLVLDKNDFGLLGIVTDRDILRSAASLSSVGLAEQPCSSVMTRSPVFVRQSQSLDDALQLMLTGNFRHLPVADDSDNIIGMMDILLILQHVQSKISNSWGKARTLLNDYRELKISWPNISPPRTVERWFEQWEKAIPTLGYFVTSLQKRNKNSLTDENENSWPHVLSGATVKYAIGEMVRHGSRAVIVLDNAMELVGIFTSKDLVLRVIAAGIDIDSCCMIRVMTPYPDFTYSNTHVDEALKIMWENNYQHLPVIRSRSSGINMVAATIYANISSSKPRKRSQTVSSNDASQHDSSSASQLPLENIKSSDIVGLCDVLSLTCHTLEHLLKQQSIDQIYFSGLTTPVEESRSFERAFEKDLPSTRKQEESWAKSENEEDLFGDEKELSALSQIALFAGFFALVLLIAHR